MKRLESIGLRSINNVVDITNYVLMETGQPLHAFDFDALAEKRIVVRRAWKQEKLEAIDGKTYTLDPSMLVIADAERAVAIAGIMGGKSTEVTAKTTTILLESARFEPLGIRTAARNLTLMSDSSFRFERGIDPAAADAASKRAAQLIQQLAGGEPSPPASYTAGSCRTSNRPPPSTCAFQHFTRKSSASPSPRTACSPSSTASASPPGSMTNPAKKTTPSAPASPPIASMSNAKSISSKKSPASTAISKSPSNPTSPTKSPARDRRARRRRRPPAALLSAGYSGIQPSPSSMMLRPKCSSPRRYTPSTSPTRSATPPTPSAPPSSTASSTSAASTKMPATPPPTFLSKPPSSSPPPPRPTPPVEIQSSAFLGDSVPNVRGALEILLQKIHPDLTLEVKPETLPGFTPGGSGNDPHHPQRKNPAQIQHPRPNLHRRPKTLRPPPSPSPPPELNLAGTSSPSSNPPAALNPSPVLPIRQAATSRLPVLAEATRYSDVEQSILNSTPQFLESIHHVVTFRGKQLEAGKNLTLSFSNFIRPRHHPP